MIIHKLSDDLLGHEVVFSDTTNLMSSNAFSFLTNQGKWLLSEEKGRFVLIDPVTSKLDLFSPSQQETYFPDSTITCALVQESNEILIGTKNGIYSLDEVTYEYENLSEKIGLKDGDRINAMVKDDNGKIWFALQKELLCWDPNKHESTRYNNALGVDVSNFLPMIAQKDELGNLYFITSDGILMLNPEKVGLPDDKLELGLYEVKVNDRALDHKEQDDFTNGTSTLKWSDNYLEFYFNTNQLFELEPHQYEYRLQGLNNKWVDIGPANHIRFDNLQHGEYSLLFKVTNGFGLGSEVFVIPFKIQKPFWLSIWFSLILIVFVGLIIYLIANHIFSEFHRI